MRNFVFLIIAVIGGFMAWLFFQPVCPGGQSATSEAECRRYFDESFCQIAFERAEKIARTSGAAYANQSECLEHFPACLERSDVKAYTPKPTGFCLAKTASGAVGRIEPQYSRIGAAKR